MAPSPEHDNEPKAPDKNDNKSSDSSDLRTNSDFLDDHLSSSVRDLDLQDSSVSTLDDGQLKALLDEAINYKTPKDREGKSRIFKVLLQEAEEDERNARAASASGPQLARYYNAAARRQRGQGGRKGAEASVAVSTTQGGSLQDLVQAGLYEVERVERCGGGRRSGGGSSRRRHHHQHPVTGRTVSVSARQREGGSLPSNVNAGALYPSDLRLFTPDKTTRASNNNNNSNNTSTPSETMVESCTESSASQPAGDAAPIGAPRPEYTVIDLEHTVDQLSDNTPAQDVVSTTTSSPVSAPPSGGLLEVAATPEETRGLLQQNSRTTSYNSTESLPRYRYHGSESSTGSLEHQEAEKEEPATEMTATGIGKRHHSTSAFDGVPKHQYFNPLEEALHHHRIPRIRYTSRATLEVDGVSGAHGATTVDKGISFPQFQAHEGGAASTTGAASLQLDPEYNSVRCIVEGGGSGNDTASGGAASGGRSSSQSVAIAPTQYRLLSVANPKIIHGVDRFQHHNTDKKGLDENGNAVSTTDAKKKKKCKVDRNVTVLKSENIPGHRAEIIESIDLLVKYIEEDDASSTKTKHHHNHHHNHHKPSLTAEKTKTLSMDTNNKKRTRMKTKSEQNSTNTPVVKKSNSLEEISKTKLEDLMSEDPKKLRVKKQSTSEDGDRRNWEEFYQKEPETEFHVVTKKKKSKKRTSAKSLQQPTTYYHYHRIEHSGGPTTGATPQAAPQRDRAEPQRRKSACSVPPSDKSADSSDVDSVHSLPVATVHRREEGPAGPQQASPSSTSYADIARTNGGSSSASSNCSSHSGSSNQGVTVQPGAPASAWKLSPQPGPPGPPTNTQTSPQQHTSPALPPALRSEHFPELCGEKDSAPGALAPPEVSPLRLESDFPTLGGDTPVSTPRTCRQQSIPLVAQFVAPLVEMLPPGPPLSAASISSISIVPEGPRAQPRQTQTDLKLNSESVPNRTVLTNSAKPYGGIARRGGSSRPAVIILDDEQNGEAPPLSGGPIQVSGLTFGFELNEQLLNDSEGDSPCGTPPPRGPTAAAEVFTARFIAPHAGALLTETYNHDKIVTFVGLAWEDVVHQTNGKVQYYNGQ